MCLLLPDCLPIGSLCLFNYFPQNLVYTSSRDSEFYNYFSILEKVLYIFNPSFKNNNFLIWNHWKIIPAYRKTVILGYKWKLFVGRMSWGIENRLWALTEVSFYPLYTAKYIEELADISTRQKVQGTTSHFSTSFNGTSSCHLAVFSYFYLWPSVQSLVTWSDQR